MASETVLNASKDLFEAAIDGDIDTLRNILETNIDIKDSQNEDSETALHMCLGNFKCTKLLISRGAKVFIRNKFGHTPLHVAAKGDLIESLIQLLILDADVNGNPPSNDAQATENPFISTKSPIELAKENHASATTDFLLFCGADIPTDWDELTSDERDKHATILLGYKEGKIKFDGLTLKPSSDYLPIGKLDIAMKLRDQDSDDVEFICRTMAVEYQTSGISTSVINVEKDQTLISYIYQYRVNRRATCDLKIPVTHTDLESLQKYTDLFLIQVPYPNESDKPDPMNADILIQNKVEFKGVPLLTHGEGAIISFCVVYKNKVDKQVDIDHNREQTFQSTVENKFKVTKPEGALKGAIEIDMEVIKVDQYSKDSMASDSDYGSCSNFHTVSTSGSNITLSDDTTSRSDSAMGSSSSLEGDIIIELPVPLDDTGQESHPVVVGCPQGMNAAESENWNINKSTAQNSKSTKVTSGCGRYIVVLVTKIKYSLMQRIRDLFMQITGPTVECQLFVAVKHVTDYDFQYIVSVNLCADKAEYQRAVKTLEQNKFHLQDDCLEEVKFPKTKPYYLYFRLENNCTVIDDGQPIQYQSGQKWTDFQVKVPTGPKTPYGSIRIYKKRIKEKDLNSNKVSNIPKYRLSVYFKTKEEHIRESFPSSKFISEVSEEIGYAYFPIGLFIGMSAVRLGDLGDLEAVKRSMQVMFFWENELFRNEACTKKEALQILFIALRQGDKQNIRSSFIKEITKCGRNSDEYKWVNGFVVDSNTSKFNFDILSKDVIVDPFEDKFLYLVAKEIVKEDFLLRLGVDGTRVMKRLQNEHVEFKQRAFDILIWARHMDGNDPPVKSLKKLFTELKNDKLNLVLNKLWTKLQPAYRKYQAGQSCYTKKATNSEICKIIEILKNK